MQNVLNKFQEDTEETLEKTKKVIDLITGKEFGVINIMKDDPRAVVPEYKTIGSAGFDFYSLKDCVIEPGAVVMVETGLRIELPPCTMLMVCSRSGLAFNYGIHVLNSPGIVDSDYRGPLNVILHNAGDKAFEIKEGFRIAQGIIMNHIYPYRFNVVDSLEETERGDKGFGSTGY